MPIRDKFCTTYTRYEDSSHGYVKVPLEELRTLGVKISGYSYKHGRFAYLEEDDDLITFAKARAKVDPPYVVKYSYECDKSFRDVRRYARYA